MADDALVTNNQEPNKRNFSGLGGDKPVVDMDIDGGPTVSAKRTAKKTVRTAVAQAGQSGRTETPVATPDEVQEIVANEDAPTATAQRIPTQRAAPQTTSTSSPARGPNPSVSRAPSPSQSSSTAAPAVTPTPSTTTTDSGTPTRSSYPTSTTATPEPGQQDLADLRNDRGSQGDINEGAAAPRQIDPGAQQAAANDLQADRQKKTDPNTDDLKAERATDETAGDNVFDPYSRKPLRTDSNPSLVDTGDAGDMMKNDIGTQPDTKGAPPQLTPEQQQEAAAQQAAQGQIDQKQEQAAQLEQQEGSLVDSASKLKGFLGNGLLSKLKYVPILGMLVNKLEAQAKKGAKAFIKLLERIKSMAEKAKTAVAIGEAWANFIKFLGSLCATGIGIVITIIIVIPGLIVITLVAFIWPSGASKTARTIDKFIEEINAILKPLKKHYTMEEQRKTNILKVRRLAVLLRGKNTTPPPGPS